MENRNFYNQILTEHNLHPEHKHDLADANLVLEGVNPSCGDDIVLKLKVEDGVITDGAFVGDGCAISQASADIMLDLIIGEKKEDALHLAELFLKMIKMTPLPMRKWRSWTRRRRCKMWPTCPPESNAPCWAGIPWKKCLTWTSSKTQNSKSKKT